MMSLSNRTVWALERGALERGALERGALERGATAAMGRDGTARRMRPTHASQPSAQHTHWPLAHGG